MYKKIFFRIFLIGSSIILYGWLLFKGNEGINECKVIAEENNLLQTKIDKINDKINRLTFLTQSLNNPDFLHEKSQRKLLLRSENEWIYRV